VDEKKTDLFHLERLRAALDSPSGYGVRVQFLRTSLNLEEQLSWFAESGTRLDIAIGANTRELHDLKTKIDRLTLGQEDVSRTLRMVASASGVDFVTPLQTQDLLSSSKFTANVTDNAFTRSIDASLLPAFHRLTCFDLPSRLVGHFRTGHVRVGRGTDYVNKSFETPHPVEVSKLIDDLCSDWRSEFDELRLAIDRRKLASVARFHARLLSIHPFEDGNGRVARAVLMQQCLDLFGRADMSLMDKGGSYYSALEAADKGDFVLLEKIVSGIIS
jgi:Fic family protein